MPRWGGSQAHSATFHSKVREMSGDDQSNSSKNEVPSLKPPQLAPGQPKRRPAKTRQQAWAKIDGGKGTWKPK